MMGIESLPRRAVVNSSAANMCVPGCGGHGSHLRGTHRAGGSREELSSPAPRQLRRLTCPQQPVQVPFSESSPALVFFIPAAPEGVLCVSRWLLFAFFHQVYRTAFPLSNERRVFLPSPAPLAASEPQDLLPECDSASVKGGEAIGPGRASTLPVRSHGRPPWSAGGAPGPAGGREEKRQPC